MKYYYKVPEMYLECLLKMSHKYQALREAYCLDDEQYVDEDKENEAVNKYVKAYGLGDDLTLEELVSLSMDEYENKYGVIEEEEE